MKPTRDAKADTKDGAGYAKHWWLHGKPRQAMRRQLAGLPRYIATVETAKHRIFQFLDSSVLPDNKLVAIALSDAFHLGVLSSRIHGAWALAAGGWLGVGNDPVYVKSRCFEAFPFPGDDTGASPPLQQRIRDLAEQLDAHRKRQQAAHPDAMLTSTYNVLEKLRSGEPLSAKEKVLHEHALIGVLSSLHEEIDHAVLAAYGWSDLTLPTDTDKLLQRLVELNSKRTTEEASGTVRWLRPDFQSDTKAEAQSSMEMDEDTEGDGAASKGEPNRPRGTLAQVPWPTGLAVQIKAVADALADAGGALDLDTLAQRFNGRGRWRERLPTILDALVALGRALPHDNGGWVDSGR